MQIVNWDRITVGYETRRIPDDGVLPDHQQLLRDTFGAAIDGRWRRPGSTEVANGVDVDPASGEWVRTVLEREVARAIAENGQSTKPRVQLDKWIRTEPFRVTETGRDGVRCEIGDDGWRNAVTFTLSVDNRNWPHDDNVVGYVTLHWVCSGHSAEAAWVKQARTLDRNPAPTAQRSGGSKSG